MASLIGFAAIIVPLVFAIVCHEVAHGWVALALGDRTAYEARRLSLNPLRHVDPIGTVVLPGMLAVLHLPVFGWAKPVPIDAQRLRNPRWGMMLVAAAGPLTNLLLAAVGAIVLGLLLRSAGQSGGILPIAVSALDNFIMVNVFLALFNLLPVPPFDGSHLVEGLLPRRASAAYAKLRPLGFPLMMIFLVIIPWVAPQAGIVGNFILPPVLWAGERYHDLATWIALP